MSEDRFPKCIYVSNETGEPGNSGIYDADTGKRFQGVVEVHVHRGKITVEATIAWPAETDVESPHGVKTTTRTYGVKRLELESW